MSDLHREPAPLKEDTTWLGSHHPSTPPLDWFPNLSSTYALAYDTAAPFRVDWRAWAALAVGYGLLFIR